MEYRQQHFLKKSVTLLLLYVISFSTGHSQEQTWLSQNGFVVQVFPIISTVVLGGTVIPAKEVTFSAQQAGRVEFIAGEEGDEFKTDDVLLRLTDTELQAQHRAATAALQLAQSDLRNADVQFSRELISPDSTGKAPGGMAVPHVFDEIFTEPMSDTLSLGDSKMDRYADLHSYSSKINQARSALQHARSELDAVEAKLRDVQSIATFKGIITKKWVEMGDTVQAGTPLLKFADITQLQIQLEVPSRLISGLDKGMLLPARLDVGGWGQVRVSKIFPIADPQHHTIRVKLDLPPSVDTRPGQYAQVEIQDIQNKPNYLPVIPRQALVWRSSLPGVYVIKDNKRELRLLRLGTPYGDGSQVTVLSGIENGDVIELNPKHETNSGWITPPSNP